MNCKHIFLIALITLLAPAGMCAQDAWDLKLDKDGIKVYTRKTGNSPFKAVRATCTVDVSLSRLTAVLLDISTAKDWVYSTKSCTLLKNLPPAGLIYYSEISIPWPVSNRDFICHLKVVQDEKTKAVIIDGENLPAYLPEKDGIVRIHKCFSRWTITPLSNGQVYVDYEIQVDPGGSVPAWLINMFATKGPYESFTKLRQQVKKTMYAQVHLPFIRD